jgi:hypothetical protein
MFYANTMFLLQTISTTNSDAKFITTSFNKNTRKALCIIAIYKPSKMKIIYILIQFWKPYIKTYLKIIQLF